MDVDKLLAKTTDALSVGRAFGTPIEREGTLIIPVAWVAGGGGGGGADDGMPEHTGADQRRQHPYPTGGGGGFGGFTWPLGVYVVDNGHVRWIPAVDATRVVLAALALAKVMAKLVADRRARAHS